MRRESPWQRILGRTRTVPDGTPRPPAVTIRFAGAGDGEAVRRLAQLDAGTPPAGRVLVAEVDDELWAAVSVEDSHAVADPFRPTGELVGLLLERPRGLRLSSGSNRGRRGRGWSEQLHARAS